MPFSRYTSVALPFALLGMVLVSSCTPTGGGGDGGGKDAAAVDPCAAAPCENGGVCMNGWCQCPFGYVGAQCETFVDECLHITCLHGGTCVGGVGTFQCTCTEAWTGQTCKNDVDECLTNPCQNGGRCTNLPGTFECTCPSGYGGPTCAQTAYCTGYATSCSDRSAETCGFGGGCSTTTECIGTTYPCSGYRDSYACGRDSRCSWSASTFRCTGPAVSCSSYGSYSCSRSGCSTREVCTGSAYPCSAVYSTRCAAQPGCSLAYH